MPNTVRVKHPSNDLRHAMLLACTFLAGCSQHSAPPARSADKAPANSASASAPASQPTAAEPSPPAAPPAPIPPAQPERVVLLTPGGPLVVHVLVSIHGEPQPAFALRILNDAAKTAGMLESDDATWANILGNPRLASGLLGNAPLADAQARDRAAKEFDTNRDGRAQRGELAALLAQNTAGGRACSVEWVNDYGRAERESSLFALLDLDADGRVNAAEMAGAAVRLRSRDADDNDVVTMVDFRPPPSPGQAMRYRRDAEPPGGFELKDFSLDSIFYTLSELSAVDGQLGRESFALAPGLLAELDTDHDGVADQREFAGLITARPDLVLKVDFVHAAAPGASPTVALQAIGGDLTAAGASVHAAPGRMTIELKDFQFDVFAADSTSDNDRVAAAMALFGRLDADNSGKLDAGEAAKLALAAGATLEELDNDRDGSVSLDEIKQAIGAQPTYRAAQVLARVSGASDPLFSWLDARPDGRLTSREMAAAQPRLAQLDRDGDGAVAATEIPERLALSIVRGGPANASSPPASLYGGPRAPGPDVPRWLSAMDSNGDDDVSAREFLGKAEQFERLDANGDGFLDTDEASRVAPATP